jgi:hypothetical protein
LLLLMLNTSLSPVFNLLHFYITTFRSVCAVPNMAVFCSSLTSWISGTLLRFIIIVIIIILLLYFYMSPLLYYESLFKFSLSFCYHKTTASFQLQPSSLPIPQHLTRTTVSHYFQSHACLTAKHFRIVHV